MRWIKLTQDRTRTGRSRKIQEDRESKNKPKNVSKTAMEILKTRKRNSNEPLIVDKERDESEGKDIFDFQNFDNEDEKRLVGPTVTRLV